MVTGEHDCTYRVDFAGEIRIDELEGVSSFKDWASDANGARNGNIEWDRHLDRGVGMTFWDGFEDEARCHDRMEKVRRLFSQKYPSLPVDLPTPSCR